MQDLFNISVASSSKKVVSLTPEFQTTPSRGGIKINEAGASLIGVKSGEYMILVTNYAAIQAAILNKDEALAAWAEENDTDASEYPVFWGVAKGYTEMDKNGNAMQTPEDLTHVMREQYIEEGKVDSEGKALADMVDKIKGSKMSTTNGSAGFGILNGADSNNWASLGGNAEEVIVYEITNDTVEHENEYGDTITVYPLVNPTAKAKVTRG